MKLFFSLIVLLVAQKVTSQDTLSVFFIGNSYTASNNLPNMVKNVANSFGDELIYMAQTPGGATFQIQANNSVTYNTIAIQPWDFVVLQAQSQEPSFPDSQVDQNTIPYAIQISDSVYANYFCTDVNMFMTWGRKDGDPQWAPISTFEGMNSRLRSAYMRMTDSVQGSVTPVGSAWAYIRANYPSLGDSLYVSDGSHPSIQGSYLAACTFYASLYRKNPIGTNYTAGLTVTQATKLQQAAAMTVLDSLDQWNLRPISEHTKALFDYAINGMSVDLNNLSTKAQDYLWSFGDGNTSIIESPTHSYAVNGNYQIQLIAQSVCDSDTIQVSVTVGSNELNEIGISAQGDGVYTITGLKEIQQIQLLSSEGRLIECSLDNFNLDLSSLPNGIYYLVVSDSIGNYSARFVHLNH